jgi:hypothetical protein
MLLELGMAVAAAYGADKLGLVNLGGRRSRSTAPVQSAQTAGTVVAPSIPGHVIPAPALVDVHTIDAQATAAGAPIGPMAALSQAIRGGGTASGGQGAPFVDAEGYWRDFDTKALYQFHDPNTGAPMGRPGYMPLRYQQFVQQQQATAAAAAAVAAGGPDQTAADAAQAVQTGLQVATTAATVAGAVAGGSTAATTAATVAGVAGSIAACLGPLPIAPDSGWKTETIHLLRAYDGDRALQVTITEAPDRGGFAVLAVEVAESATYLLEVDTAKAADAMYADHKHAMVGVYRLSTDAAWEAEEYVRHWRERRQREREASRNNKNANACACEGIEAR